MRPRIPKPKPKTSKGTFFEPPYPFPTALVLESWAAYAVGHNLEEYTGAVHHTPESKWWSGGPSYEAQCQSLCKFKHKKTSVYNTQAPNWSFKRRIGCEEKAQRQSTQRCATFLLLVVQIPLWCMRSAFLTSSLRRFLTTSWSMSLSGVQRRARMVIVEGLGFRDAQHCTATNRTLGST